MSKDTGVSSGKASSKPTDEDLKKKREAVLARLRQGKADELPQYAQPNLAGLKRIGEKNAPKEAKDIHAVAHTHRIKRMTVAFGQQQIEKLESACKDHDEFKWELFLAEQRKALPISKCGKPYEPSPKSGSAQPIEVEWRGKKYLIDAQSDFKIEYCEKLINFMQFTRSIYSFSDEIGVPYSTIKGWLRRYKCFQDAVELGNAKGLRLVEDISWFRATGMDVTKISDKFDVKEADNSMLKEIRKTRYREQFYEKGQENGTEDLLLANLEGADLDKAVEEARKRYAAIASENPFGAVKLYDGKDAP